MASSSSTTTTASGAGDASDDAGDARPDDVAEARSDADDASSALGRRSFF